MTPNSRFAGHAAGCLLAVLLLCLYGCAPKTPAGGEEEAHEAHGTSVTLWTASTELFMEVPPLVVGRADVFAVHLTRLSDATPLAVGPVRFEFHPASGGAPLVVTSDAPRSPGIFGPRPEFPSAGTWDLDIVIDTPELTDRIRVPGLTVVATAAELPHEHAPESDGIAFLKEQAWKTPGFRTDFSGIGEVMGTTLRTGRIVPEVGGEAWVNAPLAGRIVLAGDAPGPGDAVRRGQVLARLFPLPEPGGSPLPEARRELAEAEAELARAERLVAAGAAPSRRVEEARRRVQAVREALNGLTGGGVLGDDGSVALVAPIAGRVARVDLTPGARVEAGTPLVRIVDPSRLRIEVDLPPGGGAPPVDGGGIRFRVEGDSTAYTSGPPIGIAPEVDPVSRTRKFYYAGPREAEALVSGLLVRAEIPTGAPVFGTTIPESAVLEEDGRPVVYVQISGEEFERRAITILARGGGQVVVGAGLAEGERVATGAPMAVRLASLSSTVPAHGHAH
jgi:cobalt-zinc-cadmium efflux system membrane fusion protein